VPRTEPEDDHACHRAADREQPRKQVETVSCRRREDARPEVGDHLVEDLLLGPPLGEPPPDLDLHLLRLQGGRLVERLVTDRADELGLDRFGTRAAAGERGRREHQGRETEREELHVRSARLICVSSSELGTGPSTRLTIRPRRSTKKVVGVKATPYRDAISPTSSYPMA